MSFFGFEETDLEKEKQKFLQGKLDPSEAGALAVYTFGEESYDGLGDALEEGGDELNDETFGRADAVGKDFDFSNATLPGSEDLKPKLANSSQRAQSPPSQLSRPSASTPLSLESIWDDKSPFSLRLNGAGRTSSSTRVQSPPTHQQPIGHVANQSGARTLQEIEAEMRLAAERSREAALQRELLIQQQQRLEEEEYLRQQQEQELLQRQRYLYQQEQQQQQLHLQRLQQQQILQQREQQQHRTPPPRMLPVAQSPRFLEHQRQVLLLQQQQEQQQLLRLQQLEEQLRMEDLERQLRNQQISHVHHGNGNQFPHDRQPSGPTLADMEALQLQQHRELLRRSQSPLRGQQYPQDHGAFMQPNIQLQQRILSEMAHAEFLRDMQGLSQADQETLRGEAMRKILEAEKMEEKRRRKAAKIAHMSRYNDLMTQSDKDFITRIQVSQLVTQDPYADDFYAQVHGAIIRSRMGLGSEDERVLKFGASGGVGLGVSQRGGNRRPNAMQRMQQQVERIVNNARRREEEKGLHSLHSLQGALGKTSGRSYKAAPRQLLQVDPSNASSSSPTLSHAQPHGHISKADEEKSDDDAAAKAAKLGREALAEQHTTDTELVRKEPLTHREVLVTLETLYDHVLHLEQLKRNPPPEEEVAIAEWENEFQSVLDQTWTLLKVMVPLATSTPHPFISILSVAKGKKLLPRLTRHLDSQRMLTLLTLLIACFSQLDVVVDAPLLDDPEETATRSEVERQTQAFLSGVIQSILPVIAKGSLRLVSGLLGLLLDRNDVVAITKTRPGLALLTLFLTRVEVIKESLHNATNLDELPSPEDAEQWQFMFDHLFQLLTPHFPSLFPSSRTPEAGRGKPGIDALDQPVWQFLAALALHAVAEQHQVLVTLLRDKVLENVISVKKGWVVDEEEKRTKLANVDLFLHALGLDSSQIAM